MQAFSIGDVCLINEIMDENHIVHNKNTFELYIELSISQVMLKIDNGFSLFLLQLIHMYHGWLASNKAAYTHFLPPPLTLSVRVLFQFFGFLTLCKMATNTLQRIVVVGI